MQGLPVLAQALAVVGGHEEERVVPQAESAESVVEAPHELVGEGHLAVVQPCGVARRVGLGRLVGVVRIVEVQPEEDPRFRRAELSAQALQPLHGLARS